MHTLARAVLLFAGCEFLVLMRQGFGLSFCLALAALLTAKHQLLIYVPVAADYQWIHYLAAVAIGWRLMGRFVSARAAADGAGVDAWAEGVPAVCILGVPARWARRYAEPLLALGLAVVVAGTPVLLHFQPLYRFEWLPLPYGVTVPYPSWYREYAVLVARLLPLVSALALPVFVRLGEPRQDKAKAAPPREKPLTFDTVQAPRTRRRAAPAAGAWGVNPERRNP